MSEWQPIETAPNYTEIFLAYQADGRSHTISKYGIGSYSGDPDHIDQKRILWEWNWTMKPTHWMPIPVLASRQSPIDG